MPFGAAIGAIAGAGIAANSARSASSKARRRSGARGSQVNIGFGVGGIDTSNNITQDQNQFTDLSRLFANEASGQLGQSRLPALDIGATGLTAGNIGQFQGAIGNQFGQLAGAIGGQQQFDPNQFAALQFDRLNSLAQRGEETAASRTANQLFSRGRLGVNDTQTGNVFGALEQAQGDARTGRALQATQLANQEAQRLFGQSQTGIQNQFGLLNQLFAGQQQGLQGFLGLNQFNQAAQQQGLQNALGFGQGAGSVLNPNFQQLQLALNANSTDQASRAGVASNNANLLAGAGANIGNAFAELGGGITQGFIRNRGAAPATNTGGGTG